MNTITTEYTQHMHPRQDSPVGVTSPVIWLREGWNDFIASPMTSLLIGGAFTLLCLAAYAAISISPILSATTLALMLLASPFIAAIAYSVARQQQQSSTANLRQAVYEMRMRALDIGLFQYCPHLSSAHGFDSPASCSPSSTATWRSILLLNWHVPGRQASTIRPCCCSCSSPALYWDSPFSLSEQSHCR